MPIHRCSSLTPFIAAAALVASPVGAASRLQSAGALAFDGGTTLFVGDSRGGQIAAIDVASILTDQSDYVLGRPQTFEGRQIIADVKAAIGDLVGAGADQIAINDLTVHKSTGQIFLSASRGLGPDALPVVALVNQGEVTVLDLDTLPTTTHTLSGIVADVALEFGQPARGYTITDIDYYAGEIFVAGVSGETFSSTMRRIAFPFADGAEAESQIEIWHAVHAQWETRAPIIAQTIAEIEGEPTLVAVYACTPLVRISLSDLTDGARVRGEMIGELGYGNSPVDLVAFTNQLDGTPNILVTHTHRTANQISLLDIGAATPMPTDVGMNFGPDGLTGFPVPATGIKQLAMIDDNWAVALRPSEDNPGTLELHSLLAPFFFDRSDHMVEMNWPGSPDPYGYRQHPPLDL